MVTLAGLKSQNFLNMSYVVRDHIQNSSSGKTQNQKRRSLGSRLSLDPNQRGGLRLAPLCLQVMVSSSTNEGVSLYALLGVGGPEEFQLEDPLEIQLTGLLELCTGFEEVSVKIFQQCYCKSCSFYAWRCICPSLPKCAVENRLTTKEVQLIFILKTQILRFHLI